MPNVKFFYSERSKGLEPWHSLYGWFEEQGHTIHTEPIECDISVVLNGKFVNPLPLYGKKVLLYKADEWNTIKWKAMYEPVLEEYYDQMIDIEGRDLGEIIEKIR